MPATLLAIVLIAASGNTSAQSSDVMFPTPVRQPVIEGVIQPRPIGDSRLTTLYFTFDGDQGDLFVNLKTQNFTGDLDLYLAAGLKPLTKIIVYADSGERETGRVIYLRKPERLILRLEGRAIGDEEARFQIKFAGGFIASTLPDAPGLPRVPKAVLAENLPAEPKRRENRPQTVQNSSEPSDSDDKIADKLDETPGETPNSPANTDDQRKSSSAAKPKVTPEVVVSDPLAGKATAADEKTEPKPEVNPVPPNPRPAEKSAAKRKSTIPSRPQRPKASPRSVEKETPPADPLANVRLIIRFRDGSIIERPLPEVLRFSVERGVLTVIMRNGTIGRYSMLEVANVTIE